MRYYCTQPFEWMHVGPGGHNWLCCVTWLPKQVGSTVDLTPAADWNSTRAQEVRASILDGSFRHCSSSCPHLATHSGPVSRAEDVTDPYHRRIIDETSTVLPDGPRRVYASYDPSCNLACPSCRTDFYSAPPAERQRIERIQSTMLAQLGPSMEELVVSGSGDPFGSAVFRKLLQELDVEAYPRLNLITLLTNAQQWTPANWASLSRIHHLIRKAIISIDAASPATYAVNRRGGSFSRLLRNLDFIATLQISRVTVCFVVQANNFAEMAAFAAMGRERFGFDVLFNRLDNWGSLSAEEFRARAVHLPGHPQHSALLQMLEDPIFVAPGVELGNLAPLRLPASPPLPPIASPSVGCVG